jgi:hypothetical protein
VPPLRERVEDIPVIAEYYAGHYARKVGKRILGISEGALAMLAAYPWPGNVRELQNLVERAVVLARRERLEATDFELPSLRQASAPVSYAAERRQIEEALRVAFGRVSGVHGAAEALGAPRAPWVADPAARYRQVRLRRRCAGRPPPAVPALRNRPLARVRGLGADVVDARLPWAFRPGETACARAAGARSRGEFATLASRTRPRR